MRKALRIKRKIAATLWIGVTTGVRVRRARRASLNGSRLSSLGWWSNASTLRSPQRVDDRSWSEVRPELRRGELNFCQLSSSQEITLEAASPGKRQYLA